MGVHIGLLFFLFAKITTSIMRNRVSGTNAKLESNRGYQKRRPEREISDTLFSFCSRKLQPIL